MMNVVTAGRMREFDRHIIEDIGIGGVVLMENAANAVASEVLKCGRGGECVILLGRGNNGGDGLALLRLLASFGRRAAGLLLCAPELYSGDALKNYRIARKLGLPLSDDLSIIDRAGIIVDAVFGTGLSRPIERSGREYEAIARANAADAYRIAVDIPSGINGDTGMAMGIVFNADLTVTFQYPKRGLILTSERESVGRLVTAPIGLMDAAHTALAESEQLTDEDFVRRVLPRRRLVSNKGSFGRALIVAGSRGMPGAAVMASAAAVRTGAGLTRAFIASDILPAFACLPEVMPVTDEGGADALDEQLEWASAAGIGCGLGNDLNKAEKLRRVLLSGRPAVIDADALNAMDAESMALLHGNCVITPHPGEMARLVKRSTAEVLDDFVGTAERFAADFGCTVLLKSAASVIVAPDGRIRYNVAGNPGLAKGGSGDVLTGIITALMAGGTAPFDAASAGAFLLGSSAETALSLLGNAMMTALDVVSAITGTLDGLRGGRGASAPCDVI